MDRGIVVLVDEKEMDETGKSEELSDVIKTVVRDGVELEPECDEVSLRAKEGVTVVVVDDVDSLDDGKNKDKVLEGPLVV